MRIRHFMDGGMDVCLDVKDVNLIHWCMQILSVPAIIHMRKKCTACATVKES